MGCVSVIRGQGLPAQTVLHNGSVVELFRQGFLFKRAPESGVAAVSAVYRYGGQGRWCVEVGRHVLTALRVAFSQLLRWDQYDF